MRRALPVCIGFTILLAVGTIASIRLRYDPYRQPVALKIESQVSSSEALLGQTISVGSNDAVYCLEQVNKRHFYHAYSKDGRTIWRIEDDQDAGCNEMLVSFPGQALEHLNWYLGKAGEWGDSGDIRWASISNNGRLTVRTLIRECKPGIQFYDAILVPDGLYAIGTSEDQRAVVAKFDTSGKRKWLRIEKASPTEYAYAAVDGAGSLIASYDPTAIGIYLSKYSPKGRWLWFKKIVSAKNGASILWLSADTRGNIQAVVRLHHLIWMTESKAIVFSKHGSRFVSGESDGAVDESGRDQDYALMTFDPNGRLLRKTVLFHGAAFQAKSSVISNNRDVYIVGEVWKLNTFGFPECRDHTEIVKFNSNGTKAWSRTVGLPKNCSNLGIKLDRRNDIYVFGTGDAATGSQSEGKRLFIYKFVETK